MNIEINKKNNNFTTQNEVDIAEIENLAKQKIENNNVPLNRAQRRALMKKAGKAGRAQLGLVNDTAKKLSYIDLIQRLRELKEKNENEVSNENN